VDARALAEARTNGGFHPPPCQTPFVADQARIRELMTNIERTHRDFQAGWEATRSRELRARGIDPTTNFLQPKLNFSLLYEANGAAYREGQVLADKRNEFWRQLAEAVPFEAVRSGDPKGIDAVIDFLEIDIPAFRCGYAKEYCFRKLKACRLAAPQVQRLRNLALTLCAGPYRREVNELTRLMIPWADSQFVEELRRLAAQSENKFTCQRARRMLGIILNERVELR